MRRDPYKTTTSPTWPLPHTSATASWGSVRTRSMDGAPPAWSEGLAHSLARGWPWVLVVVPWLLFGLGVGWGQHATRQAFADLPAPERAALFAHTQAIVEIACPAATPELRDYCREQAVLLASFPECGEACMNTAHRAGRTRPTPR